MPAGSARPRADPGSSRAGRPRRETRALRTARAPPAFDCRTSSVAAARARRAPRRGARVEQPARQPAPAPRLVHGQAVDVQLVEDHPARAVRRRARPGGVAHHVQPRDVGVLELPPDGVGAPGLVNVAALQRLDRGEVGRRPPPTMTPRAGGPIARAVGPDPAPVRARARRRAGGRRSAGARAALGRARVAGRRCAPPPRRADWARRRCATPGQRALRTRRRIAPAPSPTSDDLRGRRERGQRRRRAPRACRPSARSATLRVVE